MTVDVTPDQETPISVRPWVRATFTPDAPRDLLERQQPRRLGVMSFLRAIPGLAEQLADIPGEYWALDVNDDGYSIAEVSCPCGHMPCVEVGRAIECPCARIYFFIGEAVKVANSPKRRQPRWVEIARGL